jgi:predicted permease
MLRWKSRRSALQQEMEAHIEIEIQENIAAGMSPEEARHAALVRFGNPLLAMEHAREVWGWLRMERLLQDIRYALRTLRHAPGYTATLVLTLALGLGAVATMLAIVDSVLVRPVALPHSEQLILLYAARQESGTYASQHALAYKQIEELRRSAHSFAGIGGYNTMARPVGAVDGTRMAVQIEVTSDFFQTLGVHAKLGGLLSPQNANTPVVVVNDDFWRERLHADPHAIGAAVRISGKTRTIIGVLPSGFRFPQGTGGAVVFLPIALNGKGEDEYLIGSAATIARIKPGVFKAQALADAQGVLNASEHKSADQRDILKMTPYRDYVTGDVRKPLLALLGGVGVLLLIAFANAANLQIGRAASRMPEMQIRAALGAGFGRLLQQLITESVLVSLAGAAVGSGIAYAAIAWIRNAYGANYARFNELAVQPVVLLAITLLAAGAGIAASLAPMARIRREAAASVSTRHATRNPRLPGILVALQVALTCVLLVTTGLFLRTFQSLENVKLGFDPRGVTTLVLMPEDQHQPPPRSKEIETRLLHRFETLPGIQSVTMQTSIPFSNFNVDLHGTTDVQGHAFQQGDSAHYSFVSTDFVHTSGIQLLRGRGFVPQDDSSGNLVVLVNQAFAHKFLSGREPIGVSLKFHRNPTDTDADMPFLQSMCVVGVVENEMQGGDLGAPYEPMVYLDSLQLPADSFLSQIFSMAAQYAVRSRLPPATVAGELRAALKQEAPTMAELSLQTMEESVAGSLAQRRLALRLVAGFGAVALLLSAIGIYGVLAYSVTLRRREIGVRLALGSPRTRVMGLIMRQAGAMVLFGLIAGFAGAWAAGHAVRSFLYGVKVLDPATLAGVGIVLLAVSALAAFLPAMRAALLDPMETIRVE